MTPDLGGFQVRFRLQYLRSKVQYGTDTEILGSLRGLAEAARSAGMEGFSTMCLQVAERISSSAPPDAWRGAGISLLADWVDLSDRYMRRSWDPVAVSDLIDQFRRLLGRAPFPQPALGMLVNSLLMPLQ